jgi:hypothetical protein
MLSIREEEIAREQVQAILAAFESQHPDVARTVALAQGDPERPKPKVRKGIDQWRARFLPCERVPQVFWHPDSCFYEVIAGELGPHFHPSERVAVQFLQASRQQSSGGGGYLKRVEGIVTEFANNNPNFRVEPIGNENRYLKVIRGYDRFDFATAAADLAFLIRATLPRFQSLQRSGA